MKFLNNVNRKMSDPLAASNKLTLLHREVQAQVLALHSNTSDFDDGDLLHRLDKFDAFILQEIPISVISLTEFDLDEEKIEEYRLMYLDKKTYPPIVFDGISNSVIDGLHRANALARLGFETINAYVGTSEHLDPGWIEEIEDIEE
jgi:hypothetical protein